MDVPEHVARFIAVLHAADKRDRKTAATALQDVCKLAGYEILKQFFKPTFAYLACVKISDLFPSKVYVKYIKNPRVLNKYKVLSRVLLSPDLMSIYGTTSCWAVVKFIEHKSPGPAPKLTRVTKYLLAVDALSHVQSIDVQPIMSETGFTSPIPLVDTFQQVLQVVKQFTASTPQSSLWATRFEQIEQDFDSLFPAIINPGNCGLVLHHGQYLIRNLMFPRYGPGWRCCIIDWDTAGISSRWRDLVYLTLPADDPKGFREIDRKLVTRYATGFGLYEEADIIRLERIYAQHRILQALLIMRQHRKLEYPGLLEYYLDYLSN